MKQYYIKTLFMNIPWFYDSFYKAWSDCHITEYYWMSWLPGLAAVASCHLKVWYQQNVFVLDQVIDLSVKTKNTAKDLPNWGIIQSIEINHSHLIPNLIFELRERTLSMQEGGRRVLQIFFKKICSPGDHRPKYFMAQ